MSNTCPLDYSADTEYVSFADCIPQVRREEALAKQNSDNLARVETEYRKLVLGEKFELAQEDLKNEIFRALNKATIVFNNQRLIMPGMVSENHVKGLLEKVREFQGDGVITAHQWFAWLVEVMGKEVSKIEVSDSSNISVHCDLDVSKHVNLYKMTVKSHEEIKQSTKSSGKILPVEKMTFTQQLIERLDERNNQSMVFLEFQCRQG